MFLERAKVRQRTFMRVLHIRQYYLRLAWEGHMCSYSPWVSRLPRQGNMNTYGEGELEKGRREERKREKKRREERRGEKRGGKVAVAK